MLEPDSIAAAPGHGNTAELLFCNSRSSAVNRKVLVVDGHGVRINVNRGHLLIEDGIGQHRRQRRIPRAQRPVRRIVVLATDGMITLDAIRWCADLGIALVQVERNGRILLVAGGHGPDDGRLRRAQGRADSTGTGMSLARELLAHKLAGQARVAKSLHAENVVGGIERAVLQLPAADTVHRLLEVEAAAANAYFGAWSQQVTVDFASRDCDKVPDHWHNFGVRSSVLDAGRSPRRAADPVNALLNYAYGLAEIECRLALIAVGLDPGLGVLHTDKKNRDSLALDLLEPIRPFVDELLLKLLYNRFFTARDFYETRDGQYRLMPTIAHELTTWMPAIAHFVGPIAEGVAHTFDKDVRGVSFKRTALTRTNSKQAHPDPRRSRTPGGSPPRPPTTCRECGAQLSERRATVCPACWPAQRAAAAASMVLAGRSQLERLRAAGRDPGQTRLARSGRRA